MWSSTPQRTATARVIEGRTSHYRALNISPVMLCATLLDDWGVGPVDTGLRGDLLEIIDDRAARRATLITHQLPVEYWHGWIGDATIADAILDRLLHNVHRFSLDGPSRRTGSRPSSATTPTRTGRADQAEVSP